MLFLGKSLQEANSDKEGLKLTTSRKSEAICELNNEISLLQQRLIEAKKANAPLHERVSEFEQELKAVYMAIDSMSSVKKIRTALGSNKKRK